MGSRQLSCQDIHPRFISKSVSGAQISDYLLYNDGAHNMLFRLRSARNRTFLLCRPVEYNWNKFVHGTCAFEGLAFLLQGIMNLILDVVIILLPMRMLWRLQMPLLKKIGIIAMFGIGALYVLCVYISSNFSSKVLLIVESVYSICVVTILRVVYLLTLDLEDFAYSSAMLTVWSVLEPTLGIVSACIPLLRPAIERVFRPGRFSWFKLSTEKTESGHQLLRGCIRPSLPLSNPNVGKFASVYHRSYSLDDMNMVDSGHPGV